MPALVSVIIPVFNGERYLGQALTSVFRQTYPNLEVIVVDDGSTDQSRKILMDFPTVKLIMQNNKGVALARNRGLEEARGEFIAFLDQDDRWVREKTIRQVRLLESQPELGFVLAKQFLFLEPGTSAPAWCRPEFLQTAHESFVPGVLLARRSAFQKLGNFNSSLLMGNDTDWILRAKDAGIKFAKMPDVLLEKRVHEGNESSRVELYRSDTLKLLRASLARKRNIAEGPKLK